MKNWTYQWKMSFNSDPSNQAQKNHFSHKIRKPNQSILIFNNNQVIQTPNQKHLVMFLDDRLNIGEYLMYITNKVNKSNWLYVNFRKSCQDNQYLL